MHLPFRHESGYSALVCGGNASHLGTSVDQPSLATPTDHFTLQGADLETATTGRLGRLHQLDGLRGVAAMSVVFEHFLLTQPALFEAFKNRAGWHLNIPLFAKILTFTPLRLFWSGAPAVAIFFILSGLVLSLPAWSGKPQSYSGFAVRRITRLMPVYLIGVALGWVLFAMSGPSARAGTSSWFSSFWLHQITAEGLVREIFFFPGDVLQLNSPLWTLVHEMRISLIFPFLVALLIAAPRKTIIATSILSLGAKTVLAKFHAMPPDIASLTETVAQIWLFCIGALIGRAMPRLRSGGQRLTEAGAPALFFFFACLLVIQWLLPVHPLVSYVVMCAASAAIVALTAASQRIAAMLTTRLPTLLGKVSYPVYAVHFPIFMFAMHEAKVSPFVIMFGSLAVAIATGWVIATCVEPPAINFGRQLGRALDERNAI